MKTSLQKMTKRLLALGLAIVACTGINAQCAANASIASQSGATVSMSITPAFQSGWSSWIMLSYGDGGGNNFSGPGTFTDSHTYTANGTYLIETTIWTYDPADTMNSCSITEYDTVVISSLPCSVTVGNVNYSQNGFMNAYYFYTNINSTNPVSIDWYIQDSLGGFVYSQTGSGSLSYTFAQNGYYLVNCLVTAYDSTSGQSCMDSSFVWLSVNSGGNPSGCNLQVNVTANQTSGLSAVIAGSANSSYTYSYISVDGNVYYNADSVLYTFPAAGNYNVCFYAEDSTASGYCYDSTCVLYNTSGTPPVQCQAGFYMYQDSLNPGVWYGVNYSSGSPYMTYQWDFGDGSTSAQPYPTHTYASAGNYIVCLTVTDSINNCTSSYCDSSAAFRMISTANTTLSSTMSSITIVASPTGIKESKQSLSDTKIFPNPMAETSAVSFNSAVAANGKLIVVGILGNTVSSEDISITKGDNNFRLNTALLTNGVYYVKIVSGSAVLGTIKAVK